MADRILDDSLVRSFMLRAMAEAGRSHRRTAEANRSLEIDALVGAVHEIGQRLGIPTPNIDTLLGLTRLMARTRGLYPLY